MQKQSILSTSSCGGQCACGATSGGATTPHKLQQIEELINPMLMRATPGGGGKAIAPTDGAYDVPAAPVCPSSSGVHQQSAEERFKLIEKKLGEITPIPKAMQSLFKLYRIGPGPSSSHTMGPTRAALRFKDRFPGCKKYQVTLYGSLALTGKGHLTDKAILDALKPAKVEIIWDTVTQWPHPNALKFLALQEKGEGKPDEVLGEYVAFSVGGGAIVDHTTRGGPPNTPEASVFEVYDRRTFRDIKKWCDESGEPLWEYVFKSEGKERITPFLTEIWHTMQAAINRGLAASGVLPGGLGVRRRAHSMYLRAKRMQPIWARSLTLFAYALAVSEENAAAGVVVTAPTCGSCGILPAVLRWTQEALGCPDEEIVRALAVAGLFGNLAKTNASISGAELGCQAEVGVACAMAAAAVTTLMGGTTAQTEHAAEMALEENLGLSCCPVEGLVQIPCIDRNAQSATRSVDCAEFAMSFSGECLISYDEVVLAMKLTGMDMGTEYKETALGGISITYKLDSVEEEKEKKKQQEQEKDARVKSLENMVHSLQEEIKKSSPTSSPDPAAQRPSSSSSNTSPSSI